MRRAALVALLSTLPAAATASAQDPADRIARATNLTIPSAPAIVLLGGDPATVVRPGFAEQYKLDLIVRDEGLAPDIALALRPAWTFLFADVDAARYRAMPGLARLLATATVSIGTTQEDDLRRMAWSVSLSPLRRDPLLDQDYVRGLSALLDVSDRQEQLAQRMATEEIRAQRSISAAAADAALTQEQRTARIVEIATALERRRSAFRDSAAAIEAALSDSVRAYVERWREQNWNATALDLGAGRLYELTGTSFDDIETSIGGWGAWISAASGFGTDRLLFSGIGHIVDIGGDTRTAIGGNIRFGGARFDAFAEYVFREDPAGDRHELGYGGSFRLDDARSVEFGLRTALDDDFDVRAFVPVVKLNWLIGGRRIEDLILAAGG